MQDVSERYDGPTGLNCTANDISIMHHPDNAIATGAPKSARWRLRLHLRRRDARRQLRELRRERLA